MKESILHHTLQRLGLPDLPTQLSAQLSGSALNSLLLDIFHRKSSQLRPAEVLNAYAENRFVRPSNAPFFKLLEIKNDLVQQAVGAGFEPLQLSPLCPLGTCAAMGFTHQDKVLSATRGTEVVADATNVLALETAIRRKRIGQKGTLRLCATHRHVRTQVFDFEGFTPHFDVFCMTSAGRDEGNFGFEKTALAEHLKFYQAWAAQLEGSDGFRAVFTPFSERGNMFCQDILPEFFGSSFPIEIKPTEQEAYYRFLRCKILLNLKGQAFEIGDCGFTDWTALLLSDQKERFFISGVGVELVARMIVKTQA